MPQREAIRFELIPLDQVPHHSPVTKPVAEPKGSQWDEVLTALDRERGKAAKIVEQSRSKRKRLKSTLRTIAKNRGFIVEVRDHGSAMYAWISDQHGRFASPAPKPSKCLDSKPTSQSVLFCNKFINLSCMALQSEISVSHLSMIFAGKRHPSLETARKVAAALGMGREEFLKGLRHASTC
ncbi:MAG TPA: helix-turn-helix transcriptional regulator [Candidatus Acidoferrum sp.]|nr:helix-turn-helix transcriptional regulator [Candidatus Acidoferrum sp.]